MTSRNSAAQSADGRSCRSVDKLNSWAGRQLYPGLWQDIRGLHGSDGEFVMTRRRSSGPLNNDLASTTSTDAWDTIDWLVKNVPRNQRPGWRDRQQSYPTALRSLMTACSALIRRCKAVVPQSPMVDTWIGDDSFHNGAFRQCRCSTTTPSRWAWARAMAAMVVRRENYDDYTRYPQRRLSRRFRSRPVGHRSAFPPFRPLMQNTRLRPSSGQLQAVDRWMASQPLIRAEVLTMMAAGPVGPGRHPTAPCTAGVSRAREGRAKIRTTTKCSSRSGPWRHSGRSITTATIMGALNFQRAIRRAEYPP